MCHRDIEDAFVELVVYGLHFTFRLFHHSSLDLQIYFDLEVLIWLMAGCPKGCLF